MPHEHERPCAHVILVTMGAPGGIGRYEQQLIAALRGLAQTSAIEFQVLQLATGAKSDLRTVNVFSADDRRLKLASAFLRAIIRHPCTVVIFGHVNLAPLAFAARLFRPRVRYIVCAYGIDVWYPIGPMRRQALRIAHTIISISSFTTEQLVSVHGVDRERIDLLPPHYSLPKEYASSLAEVIQVGPRLLSVTRLDEPEKGVDTVLRALPALRQENPQIHYDVVGEGNDLPRLRAVARELGVEECVRFRGFLPDSELQAMYAACDVFVLPSGKEGFGIVYLEAMAQNKPVVAARAGGVPDVVVDGKTGLLVPYGDSIALCEALRTLLADPELCARFGAAGQQRVEHEFSAERFGHRLAEILDIDDSRRHA